MNGDQLQPDVTAARDALSSVERMHDAGLRRGLYPRSFSVALGAWAGLLAFLIGIESGWWPLWLFAGFGGFYLLKRRQGAWLAEVHSKRQFWLLLLPAGLVCGVVFIAGNVGRQDFGLGWAPYASGVFIGVALFAVTWLAYEPTRARLQTGAER